MVSLPQYPPEIILHIFSYLDLPDLAALTKIPTLAKYAVDPVLHQHRLQVVTPSRLKAALFRTDIRGVPLRSTVGDLVRRGIIRGHGIERRLRSGLYIYSPQSVKLYEASILIDRRNKQLAISSQLQSRISSPKDTARKFVDIESFSQHVSRPLLPIIHQLKFSMQKSLIARALKNPSCGLSLLVGKNGTSRSTTFPSMFGRWFDERGRGIVQDGERVRLAICPGNVKKLILFYNELCK